MTDEELLDAFESEGVDYTIMDYVSPENIDSPSTRALVCVARNAIEALIDHLETSTGRELDV